VRRFWNGFGRRWSSTIYGRVGVFGVGVMVRSLSCWICASFFHIDLFGGSITISDFDLGRLMGLELFYLRKGFWGMLYLLMSANTAKGMDVW
jgi:hypothetical protein